MSDDGLDVDAELLAMAGDGSDSESEAGDTSDQPQGPRSPRSPSQEPKQSVEKPAIEEAPSIRRGVAQKVRKRGGKKKAAERRRELEDELDDLGDSPSPGSGGEGRMVESSSPEPEAVGEEIDEGPLYPIEGKYSSLEDRREINALPEIQREEILAERAAEELQKTQDLYLRKTQAATQAAASKHKRKAAAADLDDEEEAGGRKSSRAAKTSALDHYKKAREAKGADKTAKIDSKRDPKSQRSPSEASDRDAEGESEVEWAEDLSSSRRDEPPPELKDFDRCKIGRTGFARVCFYPGFEQALKGAFCRVSIGTNRETGENLYRVTQIKGFTTGKPYPLPNPSKPGKTFQTDQYALVTHGTATRPWPFTACSDSSFTPSELEHFKDSLAKDQVRLPRRGYLLQKNDDINKLLNTQWTDTALQEKFAKQQEMERRTDPANALKIKREGIQTRKSRAQESQDDEEVARCDAELAALDMNAATAVGESANGTTSTPSNPAGPGAGNVVLSMANSNSKTKPPSAKQTNADRMAALNSSNRSKNANDVRQALLVERKKLFAERERAAAEAARRKEEFDFAAARKKEVEEERRGLLGVPTDRDLFGDTPDRSRAGTPMSGTSTPRVRRSRAGTPVDGVGGAGAKKVERSGLGLLGKKKKAMKGVPGGGEDELEGMDLGIDVEI